ncbi:hypothetical protein OCD85_06490 [Bacillus pacificus]|uniref:hypothetical protein n=1 Tax=Bacillus TaxID=1386 RepID=UPI00034DA936|nr:MULTISPECIES: hypothetical protein [Bacillus cereus group]ASI76638.1 hypothetical protein BA202_05095 [Bacillus cereus]MCC2349432.1 hypothetical protein [Bacillus pacificus]MCC2388615.1 hypothetical protein [Bacillus pacificus]MCC2418481.1 hypothetical protein [Bacillus pacificus]MCC2469282.1 hypothetical protein [Bacillus pacificus]
MNEIENELKRYNELKRDLMTVAKCIDCCKEEDVCFYQDLAMVYTTKLHSFLDFIEKQHEVSIFCMQKRTKFIKI